MGSCSPHFSERELACPCCGVNGTMPALVEALEKLRGVLGDRPIIIDSAYRCAVHNSQVGGAPNSDHLRGLAADIRVDSVTASQLEAAVHQVPEFNAYGRSDHQNYLHVGMRSQPARWCYDARGKAISYYPPNIRRG